MEIMQASTNYHPPRLWWADYHPVSIWPSKAFHACRIIPCNRCSTHHLSSIIAGWRPQAELGYGVITERINTKGHRTCRINSKAETQQYLLYRLLELQELRNASEDFNTNCHATTSSNEPSVKRRPDESLFSWRSELCQYLSCGVGHVGFILTHYGPNQPTTERHSKVKTSIEI